MIAPPDFPPPLLVAAAVATVQSMPVPQPPLVKPLSHSVSESLDDYFRSLNGHAPTALYETVLAQVEPPLLRAALRYCNYNQSRTAEILGLNRATLRKKLRQHNISTRSDGD